MSRSRASVGDAIKKGVNKRGVSHVRADQIYRLLLADGPMNSREIAERLDLLPLHVTGSNGAMDHLLADGRAYSVRGSNNTRMYYATEKGEEETAL